MKKQKRPSQKHLQIEKTKTTTFIVVAVASVAVVATLVLGKFILDEAGYNNNVLGAQGEAISNIESNLEAADTLTTNYDIFEKTSEVSSNDVLDALPASYDFNATNTSLQFLVDKSGLRTESISGEDQALSAESEAYEPSPEEIPFGIEAVGEYHEVQDFISALNRSTRPIALTDIELSGTDDTMTITINGETYYQPKASFDFPQRSIR